MTETLLTTFGGRFELIGTSIFKTAPILSPGTYPIQVSKQLNASTAVVSSANIVLTGAATGLWAFSGGPSVGQAVPNTFATNGDPAFTQAGVDREFDFIGAAAGDKMDNWLIVNSSGVITGYNFATSNGLQAAALALPSGRLSKAHIHTALVWHKGYPTNLDQSGVVPNWKSVQASAVNAMFNGSGNQTMAGTSAALAIDVANEVADNSQSDYIRRSIWWASANADATWTWPKELHWLNAFQEFGLRANANTLLVFNDFHYCEGGMAFGQGDAPANSRTATAHHTQKWQRAIFDVIRARKIIQDNPLDFPNARIDAMGFQYHLDIEIPMQLDLIKWRSWYCNMLGMPQLITELNLKVAGQAAVGLTPGSVNAYKAQLGFVGLHIRAVQRWVSDWRSLQLWTLFTDEGPNTAISALRDGGVRDVVADALAAALANPPTADAKRAQFIVFGKPFTTVFGIEGTVAVANSNGIRGTDMRLPWSFFQREVSGLLQDCSTATWEVEVMFNRSGNNANLSASVPWGLIDSSGTNLVRLEYDAAGSLGYRLGTQSLVNLAAIANANLVRVNIRYQSGELKFCLSQVAAANRAAASTPSAVTSVTHTIPAAPDKHVLMTNAADTSQILLMGIYDTISVAASDAELQTRATIPPNFGTCLSNADYIGWGASL